MLFRFVVVLLFTNLLSMAAAQSNPGALVILDIEGAGTYQPATWQSAQPLYVGARIPVDSTLHINGTRLTLFCPAGEVLTLEGSQLDGNLFKPQCNLETPLIVTTGSLLEPIISRNSTSRPSIIWPRASLVLTPQPNVYWYAPDGLTRYRIVIFNNASQIYPDPSAGMVWLNDAEVTWSDHAGSTLMPIALTPDQTYTLMICGDSPMGNDVCNDDGILDLSFTYRPAPELEAQIQVLPLAGERLAYMTGVLLGQPREVRSDGTQVGYYGEAIQALLALEASGSVFSQSPEFHLLLAELYERTYLHAEANQRYLGAYGLAQVNSETWARALFGLARNPTENPTRGESASIVFAFYRALLGETDFADWLPQACAGLAPVLPTSLPECS
jgi:hypothetical protein